MTGKDLIVYILLYGLEDAQVAKDGTFLDFLTEVEVAEIFDTGVATVRTWVDMGVINGVRIGENVYIPNHGCIKRKEL